MEHTIVFTGAIGAGKTTAIASVSRTPVDLAVPASKSKVALLKPSPPMSMDHGMFTTTGGADVHLYSLPGQKRYKHVWDSLGGEGCMGVAILIDSRAQDTIENLGACLDMFRQAVQKSGASIVIGVTPGTWRTDCP